MKEDSLAERNWQKARAYIQRGRIASAKFAFCGPATWSAFLAHPSMAERLQVDREPAWPFEDSRWFELRLSIALGQKGVLSRVIIPVYMDPSALEGNLYFFGGGVLTGLEF